MIVHAYNAIFKGSTSSHISAAIYTACVATAWSSSSATHSSLVEIAIANMKMTNCEKSEKCMHMQLMETAHA